MHLSADPDADYDGFKPEQALTAAVRQWSEAELAGVLVNGDLSWAEGLAEDYDRLAAKLAPLRSAPVILAPGNHDDRARLLKRFAPEADSESVEKCMTVVDAPAVRIIATDSLYRTDVVPGLLGKTQRERLVGLLDEETAVPTVIVVHHPIGDGDKDLLDSDRLLRILEPRGQVKAIVAAHDHVYRLERRRGLHVVRQPAVGMPFDPAESTGWIEASFDAAGADLKRWTLDGPAPAGRIDWR